MIGGRLGLIIDPDLLAHLAADRQIALISGTNGNQTVDMKVMVHKIHMGRQLPSVVAKGKYAIGNTDWSTVQLPSDPRRCAECHLHRKRLQFERNLRRSEQQL